MALGARMSLVVEALCRKVNEGKLPVVPEQGSVGASGDLAPLAHMALSLIRGRDAIHLGPKEGLSLINGTQAMTAIAVGVCLEARDLLVQADVVGAMSLEALKGTDAAFDPRAMAVRPHPGQAESASNLRKLLASSAIHASAAERSRTRASRCMPRSTGGARDAARGEVVLREASSVTDNHWSSRPRESGLERELPRGNVAMAMDCGDRALRDRCTVGAEDGAVGDHDLSGLPW